MNDDEEDVKRMIQVINDQKSSIQTNNQIEFEDFINFSENHDALDEDDEEVLIENNDHMITEYDEDPSTSGSIYTNLILKEEERRIIDECPDQELKTLLIYNRKKNLQLIQLHMKIKEAILTRKSQIANGQHEIWTMQMKASEVHQLPNPWKLAAPYFKDTGFYCAPRNNDVERKRANQELPIYEMTLTRRWLDSECQRLHNTVICVYNIGRQTSVKKQIIELKESTNYEDDGYETICKRIKELELELRLLKTEKEKEVPPLGSDEFIDWYKVSSFYFSEKRSVKECKAMWHLYLHPNINKGKWTEFENCKLKAIAMGNNMQNWALIANELGTNRSPFTACLHFVRNLNAKLKKIKFTPEEDQLLLDTVECHKHGDIIRWSEVSRHFEERTRVQLYHRYMYYLAHKGNVTMGKFSEAEDILLMILVNKFGKQFKKCAEYMPHRSQIQLKSRYCSNLTRRLKKGSFTQDEDEEILEHVEWNGEKAWSDLSAKLRRARGQLRQRYRTIKTYLEAHPEVKSLDAIPKRRHELLVDSDRQYEFLNCMATEYAKSEIIPTLAMIEECLGTNKSVQNLDSMIVDLFASSLKPIRAKKPRTFSSGEIGEAAKNAASVLAVLRANLEVPDYLGSISQLDMTDRMILEKLKTEKQPVNVETCLVPPQLSTVEGLKSLLVMRSNLDKNHKSSVQQVWEHPNCELFSNRFKSLFQWGSVLSLEKPNENESSTASAEGTANEIQPPPTKRIKIVSLSKLMGNSKGDSRYIQPVDKSVVEALMKRNKVQLLPIQQVPLQDVSKLLQNHTKTTVPVSQIASTSSKSIGDALEDDVMEEEDDFEKNPESDLNRETEEVEDDFEDVHKLDLILKTAKDESVDVNDREDLEGLRLDVQLLSELATYDKIKMEID